jgi:DNA-binding HxlR family transcriptional regulator
MADKPKLVRRPVATNVSGTPGFGVLAAQQAVAVVGDVWTLRILRTIFRGKRRYGDFVAEFGVSRAVLTDRLAKLVAHGVLVRDAPGGGHPQYRLSASGLDLWSLFLAMWLWEHAWGTAKDPDTWAPDLPRASVVHLGCGHAMRPLLVCDHCQVEVLPFDTGLLPPALSQGLAPASPSATARISAFRRARNAGTSAPPGSPRLSRVIGDRWNSALVGAAFRGTRLFSQFESELGIGPAQLSDRLAELQQLDILRARTYAGSRQEYRLTQAGLALFPMTLELMRWANQWLLQPQQRLHLQHRPCGKTLTAHWHCSHCRQRLERETIRFGG